MTPFTPFGMSHTEYLLNTAKEQFGHVIKGLKELRYEDIPEPIRDYVEAHPYLTTIQFIALLAAFCGGQIAIPGYRLAGFGRLGPVAGSAAAWFQSTSGATRVFSMFQSAAMGGYGVAAMDAVVRAASVFGFGAATAAEWLTGNGTAGL